MNLQWQIIWAFIRARGGEPSSWSGLAIAVFIAWFHLHPDPSQLKAATDILASALDQIVHGLAGLAAAISILMPEKGTVAATTAAAVPALAPVNVT